MRKIEPEKPQQEVRPSGGRADASKALRIGVSACLLGAEVRYDGGHKRDPILTETLAPVVEWIPVCPEIELGLGVPRDTLRLMGDPTMPRLVVERTDEDLTARMQRFAAARVAELARLDLDGYVLKSGSPSCGLFGVSVHDGRDRVAGAGRGLFAAALVDALPALPVEEEGRLADPAVRDDVLGHALARRRARGF